MFRFPYFLLFSFLILFARIGFSAGEIRPRADVLDSTAAAKALLRDAALQLRALKLEEAAVNLPADQREMTLQRFEASYHTLAEAISALDRDEKKARDLVSVALDRFRKFGLLFPFVSYEWRDEMMEEYLEAEDKILTVLLLLDRSLTASSSGLWRYGGQTWARLIKADFKLGTQLCADLKDRTSLNCSLPDAVELKLSIATMKNVLRNPIFGLEAVSFTELWVRDALPPMSGTVAFDVRTGQFKQAAPDAHLQVVCMCR